MKKRNVLLSVLLLIAALLALTGCATSGGKDRAPSWLKEGTTMTWAVDYRGEKYDFIVTIGKLSPDLEFGWEMTAPADRKGKVTIKAQALETAIAQNNYFSGGDRILEDKTTVWVSRKVFDDLKKYGKTVIIPDDEEETLRVIRKEQFPVRINGRADTLPAVYGETDKGNKFWILDNLGAPIILHMNLGWDISLKEIQGK